MIPSTAHFVWFGSDFPWLHLLAMRSAQRVGGFERVVLHHDSDLSAARWWPEATRIPGFEARRLEPEALIARLDDLGAPLIDVYRTLDAPAARSNLVRAAILWLEGGVYLDLDTVTVGSFEDLLADGAFFCGEEPIAYPATVLQGRDPLAWAGALARDGLRDVLRRLPNGWRTFRRVEGLYHAAVNNAVLGAPAGHPFTRHLLETMTRVPAERRTVRYELGTSLLQNEVAGWDAPGLRVYPPEFFFPLGPEISTHWFRTTRTPDVDAVLTERARVVHWYASVRTKEIIPRFDPEWVEARHDRELLSALVRERGLDREGGA